jgi:hypothetical protein
VCDMIQTPTYRLLATLLGRDPLQDIHERRERGQSWRNISLTYRDEHQVDITEATLRQWVKDESEATTSQSA